MTRPYISKHKVHSNNITNFQPSEKVDYDRPLTEEEKAITYYVNIILLLLLLLFICL